MRYEHFILRLNPLEKYHWIEQMNKLGDEGWKLVSVVEEIQGFAIAFFIRRKLKV